MINKTPVRIIVVLSVTLLFTFLLVRYKFSLQAEETWLILSHMPMVKNDNNVKFDHIITNNFSSSSHYLILDHEFPNCQQRTIYNGNAEYSLPDIIKFIRKYIPPPSDFAGHLKNPCWFANYDKVMSDLIDHSNVTKQDDSCLLPNTNGTKTLYCLPYMYLLGYPKCGTTSLYSYIKQHPEFVESATTRGCGWIGIHTSGLINGYPDNVKSVFYLLSQSYPASKQIEINSTQVNNKIFADFNPGSSWRQSGFEHLNKGSMCDPPLLLREMQPNAKFVVLLREPISRLYSAFWFYAAKYNYQDKLSPEIFTEDVQTFFKRLKLCDKRKSMLNCLREAQNFDHHFKDYYLFQQNPQQLLTGFYYLYLLPWLQVFPRKSFLFIRTEDMKKDTGKTLQEIFRFLEMSPLPRKIINSSIKTIHHEQTMLHDNSSNLSLSSSTKKQLKEYFKPFNEKLAKLLNDDRFLWEDID